jgi:CelD/BcsL family acetyltransferase involved in cellulose biosynthesis
MNIRIIETDAEFAALADTWEATQADAVTTSVFGGFDWQHLWWRTYGEGKKDKRDKQLKLLVATEGDAVVGLLALHIQTVPILRVPVRLLRFVGTGGDTYPDDLGPVLARGHEAATARALADAAVRLPGWDVLLLTDLDPACPFTKAIETAARAGRLDVLTGQAERIAYIDLPATFEAWLQTLHGDRRYRIRKIRKKANAAHPTRFFVFDDPATLDQGIDKLIALHHKRWKSIGQAHAFATPEYVEFHRAVMAACLRKNRLRLYALELGGQVVAMYYFYKFRDRVYLMQSGFDPDFSDVKPGQVLLGYIIESAINEGHKVLDFLKGDHRYKEELAGGERETLYVTGFRLTPGALVYRLRRHILPAVKARVKEVVRKLRPPPADAGKAP